MWHAHVCNSAMAQTVTRLSEFLADVYGGYPSDYDEADTPGDWQLYVNGAWPGPQLESFNISYQRTSEVEGRITASYDSWLDDTLKFLGMWDVISFEKTIKHPGDDMNMFLQQSGDTYYIGDIELHSIEEDFRSLTAEKVDYYYVGTLH